MYSTFVEQYLNEAFFFVEESVQGGIIFLQEFDGVL